MKRLKGIDDIAKRRVPRELPRFSPPGMDRYAHRSGETPTEAAVRGVTYTGVDLPEKGKRDGACNRTGCQLPLFGPRWSLPNHSSGGRLYYCQKCVDKFHAVDRSNGRELRCTIMADDR